MDLRPDPLQAQLRRALRAALGAVPPAPGTTGAPADPQAPRAVLRELGTAGWELPAAAGGLGLGLAAGVTVCTELGRAGCADAYRGGALLADAGRPELAGTAVAVADPTGRVRRDGDTLTGTLPVDAPADLVVVPLAGTLVLVGGDLPAGPGWPPVLRADRAPIVATLPAALDRARVRHAGYLLGLAAAMLDGAVGYAGRRRQFGTRLRDFQAVSGPLARSAVALRAGTVGVHRATRLVEDGHPEAAPAEALAAAAETVAAVARASLQVCGVRGMTAELPLQRWYRLAGAEAVRFGRPGRLWQEAGAHRLATYGRVAAGRTLTPTA